MEHSYFIPSFRKNGISIDERTVKCLFTSEKLEPQNSLGSEVELALVDTNVQCRKAFLSALNLPEYAHSEVSPEVAEINVQPGSLNEVSGRLFSLQHDFCIRMCEQGILPFPFGKVPFANEEEASDALWNHVQNHPIPHYQYLVHRDREHLKKLTGLSGIQFHYQEREMDKAINITKGLSYLTPYFAALSASSPISNGRFFNYRSERARQKKHLPYSGSPPSHALSSATSLREYLRDSAQNMRTLSPGYYDVRLPRVEFGTIENCALDSIPDVRTQQAFLAVNAAICKQIGACFDSDTSLPAEFFGELTLESHDRKWINIMKHFLLTRERLQDAQMFPANSRSPRPFSEMIHDLLEWSQCDDVTKKYILSFIEQGTFAERIVDGLDLNPKQVIGKPTIVDPARLSEVYGNLAQSYIHHLMNEA